MKRMESFDKNYPKGIVDFAFSPVLKTGSAVIIFGFTVIDMLTEINRRNALKSFKAYFI